MQSMTLVMMSIMMVAAAYVPDFDRTDRSQPIRLADLRSFFHGEAPPQPKALPPKRVATVSTAAGVAVDAQIESFLRGFADALMAREAKPLLTRLSSKYSVDNLPSGKQASAVFAQAIEQLPGPTDIVVKSIDRTGDVRSAKVEMRFGADNVKTKLLRFDADGRLLWSDLFALKVQTMAG